ncbi:Plasmodium variant antigen protein Cir/Yir/Bir, putative, partial [Plasmodium chabaudi adami]
MTQSSDNLKDLYNDIFKINDYFYEGENGQLMLDDEHGSIEDYCDYGSSSGNGKCQNDYLKMASSGVIHLLKDLMKYGLENDKLAEYAILFLSYKLDQKKKDKLTDLNKFYTDHIETNKYYNEKIKDVDTTTYKDIINKKINLLNINEISKFNDPFGILLLLYHVIKNNKLDCTKYSSYPKNFADQFETLNNDSNNIENSSYNKLLSTLSNDYNNLKNKYDNKNSCSFPSLPKIKPKKNSVEDSGKGDIQILGEGSEGTSSPSILKTVIPVLSTFFVISLFLGVAYK